MIEINILAGPVCSGKGELVKKLQGIVISSSDLITADKARMSPEEKASVESTIGSGNLYDDEKMIFLVENRLKEVERNSRVIMDGFPRTVPQARYIIESLIKTGRFTLGNIMSLEVSFETCKARLEDRMDKERKGLIPTRSDSNFAVFKKRFEQHQQVWPPVMKYFTEVAKVKVDLIDAEKDRAGVYLQAEKILRRRSFVGIV